MKKTRVVDIHRKNGKTPYFDIYIGRAEPRAADKRAHKRSKWACDFRKEEYGELVFVKYKHHVVNTPELINAIEELRGMVLGCWCVDSDNYDNIVCHGQVLIKILDELKGNFGLRRPKGEKIG